MTIQQKFHPWTTLLSCSSASAGVGVLLSPEAAQLCESWECQRFPKSCLCCLLPQSHEPPPRHSQVPTSPRHTTETFTTTDKSHVFNRQSFDIYWPDHYHRGQQVKNKMICTLRGWGKVNLFFFRVLRSKKVTNTKQQQKRSDKYMLVISLSNVFHIVLFGAWSYLVVYSGLTDLTWL